MTDHTDTGTNRTVDLSTNADDSDDDGDLSTPQTERPPEEGDERDREQSDADASRGRRAKETAENYFHEADGSTTAEKAQNAAEELRSIAAQNREQLQQCRQEQREKQSLHDGLAKTREHIENAPPEVPFIQELPGGIFRQVRPDGAGEDEEHTREDMLADIAETRDQLHEQVEALDERIETLEDVVETAEKAAAKCEDTFSMAQSQSQAQSQSNAAERQGGQQSPNQTPNQRRGQQDPFGGM